MVRDDVGASHEERVDRRNVGDGGNLVVVCRRIERQSEPRVHDTLLEQRVAESHDDAAFELALGEHGIDDATGVVRARDAEHANASGVHVHFHLGELGGEGGDRGIGRVRAPAALTHDHHVAELSSDLRERHRALVVRDAHHAAAC